jgi:hypothetical protein
VRLKRPERTAGRVETIPIDAFRGDELLPTQEAFLQDATPAKVYIGPFGSGKTKVLCWQAIILSHWFAPNCGLVGRFTYPELRDTTRKQFMEYVDPRLIDKANTSIPEGGGGHVTWKIGGQTLFRNLDSPEKFGSLALGYAGIDEITECPSSVFDHLHGRVGRHWNATQLKKEDWPYSPLYGVGNPGGQDWVWRLFFKDTGQRDQFAGFQPKPRENEKHLPPGYYDNLAKGKAKWWIKRFLEGDMRALEGLVWPQFEVRSNVVRPFLLPKGWSRITALDHGRRNPTAHTWSAVDYDGNLIVYRDYEVAGPSVAEHARAIMSRDRGETYERRVADPSIFAKNQSHGDKWHSIAEEYAEWGLDLEAADNAMDASLDRVGVLLWPDPTHTFPEWHPRAGQKGAPRLYFFENCERTIECVSSWRFKDFRGDGLGLREEPVDFDDHLPDCVRYTVLTFTEPSKRPKMEKPLDIGKWQRDRNKALWREASAAATDRRREPDY